LEILFLQIEVDHLFHLFYGHTYDELTDPWALPTCQFQINEMGRLGFCLHFRTVCGTFHSGAIDYVLHGRIFVPKAQILPRAWQRIQLAHAGAVQDVL
jgi:hypothetical protein